MGRGEAEFSGQTGGLVGSNPGPATTYTEQSPSGANRPDRPNSRARNRGRPYMTMPRRHLLATDGWKIEGKKGIVDHGGCGKSVVRGVDRLGNEFIHDSKELRHTRKPKIRCGVNIPG